MIEKKNVVIFIVFLSLILSTATISLIKNYSAINNGKIKIFRTGFLGMNSYGNPVEKLGSIISIINSHKTETGWPDGKIVFNYAKNNPYLIYYSYTTEGFQISYWSGETTWIYDSQSDAYYEFTEDIINSAWYDVKTKKHLFPNEARTVGVSYTKLR